MALRILAPTWVLWLCTALLVDVSAAADTPGHLKYDFGTHAQTLPIVEATGGLYLDDMDRPFYQTANRVIEGWLISVPDSPIRLAVWSEALADGQVVPFYAISLDGKDVVKVRRTSYEIKLRHGDFDPGVGIHAVEELLKADAGTNLYIVQFVTQPLGAFRTAIEELGGSVHQYLAHHAHIVSLSPEAKAQVDALPFVRWVGPYHPAYRMEEALRDQLTQGGLPETPRRYHIQVVRRGAGQKAIVADRIRAIGGAVEGIYGDGFLLDASLTPGQLLDVVCMNEVLFVDRWLPPQTYMNNVREDGGGNHIETAAGYTGAGVRAEVMDSGLMTGHSDFQVRPPIIHGGNSSNTSHGTSVYGINFGIGTGDATARGMVPDAQGIFASYSTFGDRYVHTSQLVNDPYNAVYQTNSWGSCCTTQYGTAAELMDEMIFDFDLIILQAQANEGSQSSDVSAFAKNVVSVGGIRHFNTLPRTDDTWTNAGSIGPAADGRVKPDLSYWYDSIRTTSDSGGYTSSFGGTSAATPETAGHFGLLFQMWADGIFGNEVDPGGSVFDNRPHASTAKALMINTAEQYPFSGTGHDRTRTHQGWGTANVGNMYDLRDKISVIDESVLLGNLESVEFFCYVDPGEPALRITMVYTDPPGTTSSSQHRINDLTLKVTTPSEIVYWGNNGLLTGNWSSSGGTPNTIDTVENVFIQSPEAGIWSVEIFADEVNQDSHVETPQVDADFALVVSGGFLSTCSSAGIVRLDAPTYACNAAAVISVVDCDLNTDDEAAETIMVTIASTTEPAGEAVMLVETGPLTADFRATIPLSTTDAAGVLHVSPGDTVTITYIDADDGAGGTNLVLTDTAIVDCDAPQITNVQAPIIEPRNASVTFDTDESAEGSVQYGTTCGSLTETVVKSGFNLNHSVNLAGLNDNTTYYYAAIAADAAENTSLDDNGGVCYSFTTPEVPDYFTEEFTGDFDLANQTITYTPVASPDAYCACRMPASEFPTDPAGGTGLSLGDDAFQLVSLGGGQTVSLYGVDYSSFYVNSNGSVTFGAGDSEWEESVPHHFSFARVAPLFVDFNPLVGGTISWKQLIDRVAVTWNDVSQYGTTNSNSFQIELFFDRTIRLSWLTMDATTGISGLSASGGQPPDFLESNLMGYGACPCDGGVGDALAAAYPQDRRKNRYISFDPNKEVNDGRNVAFKIRVKQLMLGSCSDNGGFCRVDRGADDCKTCSVSGNSCINGAIDCAPIPAQTCELSGGVCVNDAPDAGGTSVGRTWWVGPESPLGNGVHLAVSQPFRKESTSWPNPTHVGDCEVVPEGVYGVTAVRADTGDEAGELLVETTLFASISASWWGDCVGPLQRFCGGDIRTPQCSGDGDCTPPATCDFAWTLPDGAVNFDDIGAALAQVAPGPGSVQPHMTWIDLHGNGSGTPGSQNYDPPNFVANFSDVGQILFGFQGLPYKGFDPADCPDVAVWP